MPDWEETVQPGATWSQVMKRGTALRLTDVEGGANAAAIFYNFDCAAERYNMADTLKIQHTARLTRGHVLYSDMGRILCSIVADSVGWHDPLGGLSNAALVASRYGHARYQEAHNDCFKNSRECLLLELQKWGLDARDLAANVNFFSRLEVAGDGGLSFHEGNSKAGDYIELRTEMNVLAVINTCQHPLDPAPAYAPRPVHLTITSATAPGVDDACRISCPENERGFIMTERYFL